MANDLAQMKSRIADELARSDLTSQIAYAISDAISFYQNERFVFNESRDITFKTVAGQDFYGVAANAGIPNVWSFDYLILYLGGIPWPIKRRTPLEVEILNNNGLVSGQPYNYAWYNKQIRLGPVPDGIYTIRFAGLITYAAPASDNEANNPWMIDAEKLIRSRAKYELALNVLQDTDMAQIMAAQTTEAFDQLKGAANQLTGTGEVSPTQF
jgi:putative flippase GtrA